MKTLKDLTQDGLELVRWFRNMTASPLGIVDLKTLDYVDGGHLVVPHIKTGWPNERAGDASFTEVAVKKDKASGTWSLIEKNWSNADDGIRIRTVAETTTLKDALDVLEGAVLLKKKSAKERGLDFIDRSDKIERVRELLVIRPMDASPNPPAPEI